MGFLPSISSIINKLVKKVLSSRVFNAAFCLFLPGQLFARHNLLNGNYSQHKFLYLPFFWLPPLSIIPFIMMLSKKKFRKLPNSARITLIDVFAWVLISIISFCVMIPIPIIADYLMGDDKLGRLVDKFLPELFVNTIAKSAGRTLLAVIIVYLVTLFIEWLKYQKKCRKRNEKISVSKLFKASLIPTAAAAFIICTTSFFAPLRDILISIVGITPPEGSEYLYNIPVGIVMAAFWLFFAQYNIFLTCAK
jgi:hypothetical protein